MKIDPRIQFPNDNQADKVKGGRNSAIQPKSGSNVSGSAPATGEDTVSISTTHGELQSLTANLSNVPDVRLDRVSALQPQVSSGQYQPDSGKIADALIVEQSRRGLLA